MIGTLLHFVGVIAGLPLAVTANVISLVAVLYSWNTRKKVDSLIQTLSPSAEK
jgi:hypothetical protein